MPLKYDNGKVIRRLANGACVMKRICSVCRKGFTGDRNLCPQCRNLKRRLEGKFGATYHRRYYHRFLSKSAMLHERGSLSRKRHVLDARKKAFEKQKSRIRDQLAMIRKAGLNPDSDSVLKIECALEEILNVESNHKLTRTTTNK